MLLPSANVLEHVVTLTLNTWGQDNDGFRVLAGSSTVANVPCMVDPGEPVREVQSRDGQERVTTLVPHDVVFLKDYGLKIDDELDWNDGVVTHHMIVVGIARQAGRTPIVAKANERL